MDAERTPMATTVPFEVPYDRVAYHRYRVRLVAKERIVAPPERLPNMLRGTFEMAFRYLVCHNVELDCRTCPLQGVCPYPPVFRPTPPVGAERLSKQSDLPRPFVFEPPLVGRAELAAGDVLEVGLTLFGAANRSLPYAVVALRSLAQRGLGPTRGRLELQGIVAEMPAGERPAYDASRSLVSIVDEPVRLPHVARPADERATRVSVHFLTPTTLKRDGELVEEPIFGDIVRRARDRLSTIAAFFGDGPLTIDFAGVGRAADEVRTVEVRTEWTRRTRRSSRSGGVHETSGFVGHAVYEGRLGPFMPLLRAAELLHVGKYAVWGNGRVELESVQ